MRIAGIATFKGRENEIIKTVESLLSQVDKIHIYWNDSGQIESEKVINYSGVDLGDAGKFFNVPANVTYFPCDDDLIYPLDYCDYMESKLIQYNCPISLHGKIIKTPVNSYYKSGIKLRCLDTVDSDVQVNVIGTGTLAFSTSNFTVNLSDFKQKNMADIWFSVKAHQNNIPLLVAEHQKGYVKYQQVSNTIYERFKNNDKYQTGIVNQYL